MGKVDVYYHHYSWINRKIIETNSREVVVIVDAIMADLEGYEREKYIFRYRLDQNRDGLRRGVEKATSAVISGNYNLLYEEQSRGGDIVCKSCIAQSVECSVKDFVSRQ